MALHPHDPVLDSTLIKSAIYALAALGMMALSWPVIRAIATFVSQRRNSHSSSATPEIRRS